MTQKIWLLLSLFFFLIIFFSFSNNPVYAVCTCNGQTTSANQANCYSTPDYNCSWTADSSSGGTVSLPNPLPGSPTIPVLLGTVINTVLGIVGSLALVMFIYGGFTWMLAAGSAEKVKKGRDILIWATLGLVIIFTSYALVKIVFVSLGASGT